MPVTASAPFSVCRGEPLARVISAAGIPVSCVGLVFFLGVSASLSLWAVLTEPSVPAPGYLSYVANVSWSFSIILLFPVILPLTLAYYRIIPSVFASLEALVEDKDDAKVALSGIYARMDRRFNGKWAIGGIVFVTLAFNILSFRLVLNQGFTGWMSSGHYLSGFSNSGGGFTGAGLFAAIIQTVLIYWILNFLWRGMVTARGLTEFFGDRRITLQYMPHHQDRCCGFKKVGNAAILLNSVLFLLGVYISLKLFDKIFIQDTSVLSDISSLIILGGYLVTSPVLFYLTISSTHRFMIRERKKFLEPANRVYETLFADLPDVHPGREGISTIENTVSLKKAISDIRKGIRVWPFDFRFTPSFAIIAPILSLVASFALISLKNIVLVLRAVYLFMVTAY